MKNKGLGRGLGALISENSTDEREKLLTIDIDQIKPNRKQPRKEFDSLKMNELMNSIKQYGIIQPIVVRSVVNGYEIIAGERRWRAAKNLNIGNVPVVIRKADDETVSKLALIENIQREDLNEIEEANAYALLIEEYNLTQKELSEIVGKSRPYIANILRLLKLDEEIKNELINREITNGHARALLALENKEDRLKVLDIIIKRNYSVRKTEKFIKSYLTKAEKVSKYVKTREVVEFENKLTDRFGTKVNIKHNNKFKGKIEIEYYNLDDLNRILEII
ncbi:ParB/RepB/Spo0J family partition protein [Clostridiaceae bacterium HSG29]|nr:ParB/RepB/Spo0J family partition protein [Clostridiaceae bacterium HSG29]